MRTCCQEPGLPGPGVGTAAAAELARGERSSGTGLRVYPPPTGSLIQVPMSEKGKITRGRLGSLSLKKEGERQCFLFSKHLIICTRGSGGKLHLTKVGAAGAGLAGGSWWAPPCPGPVGRDTECTCVRWYDGRAGGSRPWWGFLERSWEMGG